MNTLILPHNIYDSLFLFTSKVTYILHITSQIYFTHTRKRKRLQQLPCSSWPTENICIGFLVAPYLHMHTVFSDKPNPICRLYMKIMWCLEGIYQEINVLYFLTWRKSLLNSQFAVPETILGTKHYNSQSWNKKANLAFKEQVGRKIITCMFGICWEIIALALNTLQKETDKYSKNPVL